MKGYIIRKSVMYPFCRNCKQEVVPGTYVATKRYKASPRDCIKTKFGYITSPS